MEFEIPDDMFFTKEHEWVRQESNNTVSVGITEYAQDALGDIVFVELPENGEEIKQEDTFGVIESVKAVSDLFAPVSGEIADVNSSLVDSPELINKDPYGEGWIIKINMSDDSELHNLLDPTQYEEFITSEPKGESE